jgi:hypothetical protein
VNHVRVRLVEPVVEPGAVVAGEVDYDGAEPGATLAISLLWCTAGKGTEDVGVVARHALVPSGPNGTAPFRFQAPAFPWSFSGRLLSLEWFVEASVEPGGWVDRQRVVIAPGGAEVRLGAVP